MFNVIAQNVVVKVLLDNLMTKEEVIKRMCQLITQVGSSQKFQSLFSHDCICGENKIAGNNPRVDIEIIQFIEKAVQEKLNI
jgi:hypothetical protein